MMKSVILKSSKDKISVGKILCVGKNYVAHAKEMGSEAPKSPIIFQKPASVLIQSGENVVHPDYSKNLHYEAELVLLIGETLKNASQSEAASAILGYGVGLDMTLRDLQNTFREKGHPWTLAKCFDTSAVVSEFVLNKEYKLTLDENIQLSVNSEVRQDSILNNMIFTPTYLTQFLSKHMTLHRGDLIFTGTPAGVGRVVLGDKITASISNIASLNTKII